MNLQVVGPQDRLDIGLAAPGGDDHMLAGIQQALEHFVGIVADAVIREQQGAVQVGGDQVVHACVLVRPVDLQS